MLIESALKNGESISIALTAPTGKAALRLKESIDSSVMENPPSESVMALIPGEALTIHRLLGYRSHGRGFVYNEDNPLPHDVVVVDECSMVDLPLMCRLVKALKPECRIILLGDKDQLASVEGGAVFGDICDRGNEHGYSLALAKEID
ncbi:MAG: AAA family ATPase, partial [Spirochaetota bacterium]